MQVGLRSSRTKRAPVWLSDCLVQSGTGKEKASLDSLQYISEEDEEESDIDVEANNEEDEDFFSKLPYAPKRSRTALQKVPINDVRSDTNGKDVTLFTNPSLQSLSREATPQVDNTAESEASEVDEGPDINAPGQVQSASAIILALPGDVLARILSCLPINILLQASGVCKGFADASETIFEEQCRAKRFKPPRRPRGEQAEVRLFPWRSLFRRHACQGCGKGGEFPVRVDFSGALAFLVCRRCAMNNRERLAYDSLYIDLVGISGKRLITNNKKNRVVCKRLVTA